MNLSGMEEDVEDDLVEDDRMGDVEIENIKLNCGFERYPPVDGHPPGNEKTYPTKRQNEKTLAQVAAGWQGIWDSFEEGSLTRQPEGVHPPSHWYIYIHLHVKINHSWIGKYTCHRPVGIRLGY